MTNKTKPEENAVIAEPATAPYDIWKDMVKIKVPRDKDDKGDLQVMINDRSFIIQRNVEVEVPRPVYERLVDIENATRVKDITQLLKLSDEALVPIYCYIKEEPEEEAYFIVTKYEKSYIYILK